LKYLGEEEPMTAHKRFLSAIILPAILAILPLPHGNLAAQTPSADAAILQLAARIAEPLQMAHATKVIFADLKGPQGEVHPVGRWLADQLAASCNKDFPSLEVILRPANEDAVAAADGSNFQTEPAKSLEDWARRMGANVFVSGTFARLAAGCTGDRPYPGGGQN
jgi:hypothetical protein